MKSQLREIKKFHKLNQESLTRILYIFTDLGRHRVPWWPFRTSTVFCGLEPERESLLSLCRLLIPSWRTSVLIKIAYPTLVFIIQSEGPVSPILYSQERSTKERRRWSTTCTHTSWTFGILVILTLVLYLPWTRKLSDPFLDV